MRSFLPLLAVLALAACAPCEQPDVRPSSVCRRADAGSIEPDASFTLFAQSLAVGTSCAVTVDGGSISFDIPYQSSCTSAAPGISAPMAPSAVACAVPALPAGTYTVLTRPQTTLTLPLPQDGGVGGLTDCFP
ncbi:MAG: hypothetical protein ACOZQL_18010 [Myxococcota bacterium]